MARTKAVTIMIDGEARSYKLGNNEMCEVEELLDDSIIEIFNEMQTGKIKFAVMRTLLFVGLKHGDRKLTINDIGDMMNVSEFGEYSIGIAKAISQAFEGIPKTVDNGENENGEVKKKV